MCASSAASLPFASGAGSDLASVPSIVTHFPTMSLTAADQEMERPLRSSRSSNNDDQDWLLLPLIHDLVASHKRALHHTEQRNYRQVLSCLDHALCQLHDYETNKNNQQQQQQQCLILMSDDLQGDIDLQCSVPSNNEDDASPSIICSSKLQQLLVLIKIESSLLYARALARLRDSAKASAMLRECRALIQAHTPYRSVTEYQKHHQRQEQPVWELLYQTITTAAAAKDGSDGDGALPNDFALGSKLSRADRAIATKVTAESRTESRLAIPPVATIEFIREQQDDVSPTLKQSNIVEYDSCTETYTGDSSHNSDSDDSLDSAPHAEIILNIVNESPSGQSFVAEAQQQQQQLLLITPRAPSPMKSCLRNTSYYTRTTNSCSPPPPLCDSDSSGLADPLPCLAVCAAAAASSFASFACQSTLSAVAAPLLLSPKRVTFHQAVTQQHDRDEQRLIKAFVPRQKLKMLRDQRMSAKVAAGVDNEPQNEPTLQLCTPAPMDASMAPLASPIATGMERIQELSSKLRQAEMNNVQGAQQQQISTRLAHDDQENESVLTNVSVTPSSVALKTSARAAKAMTVFVGYMASVLVRPSPQ
ncbi:hypothetical protein MPSEU_000061900 [Mayamaea pseudoterrestris]|nr:hypothetical protein MPSEU_000061900 [Mayamaea pseudoterrestris]